MASGSRGNYEIRSVFKVKDSITLHIKRNKVSLDIVHNGKVIGNIAVSEMNRSINSSLKLTSDKSNTVFLLRKVVQDVEDETIYNREEFNR